MLPVQSAHTAALNLWSAVGYSCRCTEQLGKHSEGCTHNMSCGCALHSGLLRHLSVEKQVCVPSDWWIPAWMIVERQCSRQTSVFKFKRGLKPDIYCPCWRQHDVSTWSLIGCNWSVIRWNENKMDPGCITHRQLLFCVDFSFKYTSVWVDHRAMRMLPEIMCACWFPMCSREAR